MELTVRLFIWDHSNQDFIPKDYLVPYCIPLIGSLTGDHRKRRWGKSISFLYASCFCQTHSTWTLYPQQKQLTQHSSGLQFHSQNHLHCVPQWYTRWLLPLPRVLSPVPIFLKYSTSQAMTPSLSSASQPRIPFLKPLWCKDTNLFLSVPQT